MCVALPSALYWTKPSTGGQSGEPEMTIRIYFRTVCFRSRRWLATAIACSDDSWPRLAHLLKLDDLANADQTIRREHRAAIHEQINAWSSVRNSTNAAEELQALGVAAYPVHDAAGANSDPQLAHRQHQIRVPQSHAGQMWTHSCRTKCHVPQQYS